MKDLRQAKQILGVRIIHDHEAGRLWLSQEIYFEKMLQRFNMDKSKPVSTLLEKHHRLSSRQCPSSDEEKTYMRGVSYSSTVESLMYALVCTRSDITHIVGIVSRFLSNPGKEHWFAVK
ncbi:hypothetical protein Nepgr_024460 [Nepenthes gracilis]|uniref:Retrovirus-related Pol polyprotein from transposon TNT 1-94 n=1 Tax=Nepenthes gracilis TaxID=150966 RepID=A0AAD3XYM2_NEPGR|nr:hypothetical protein Nepgr_024460 [Nepenthes gracilis]